MLIGRALPFATFYLPFLPYILPVLACTGRYSITIHWICIIYILLVPRGQILESFWDSYLSDIYWVQTVYRCYSRFYEYSSEQIELSFLIDNATGFSTQKLFSNILFLFLTKLENVQVTQVSSVCVCPTHNWKHLCKALSAANLSLIPAATFINYMNCRKF